MSATRTWRDQPAQSSIGRALDAALDDLVDVYAHIATTAKQRGERSRTWARTMFEGMQRAAAEAGDHASARDYMLAGHKVAIGRAAARVWWRDSVQAHGPFILWEGSPVLNWRGPLLHSMIGVTLETRHLSTPAMFDRSGIVHQIPMGRTHRVVVELSGDMKDLDEEAAARLPWIARGWTFRLEERQVQRMWDDYATGVYTFDVLEDSDEQERAKVWARQRRIERGLRRARARA